MVLEKNNAHKIILLVVGMSVLVMGILLFLIPPALFPDPAQGLQVLRSMQAGSGFNNFTSPDQSDISQNYTEFLTWWTPGQYLVPCFFKLITGLNMGRGIAITVALSQLSGLAGFYYFFKKAGFTPLITALSLVFITCQQAFMVPYVYYNGGEILLFAFQGWFLYGCISIEKPGQKLVLFVLLSGWVGFFCKSSFLWMYAAGLCCLWIQLCANTSNTMEWLKKACWVGIPAAISIAVIYLSFISKGRSPASTSTGFKLAAEAITFPLGSPLLSGFSIDDLVHGLIYHTWKPVFNSSSGAVILIIIALLSILLIIGIFRYVPNKNYRVMVGVFYVAALLFFGMSYLNQLNISYEGRHFRIIGILIVPGVLWLISRLGRGYKSLFAVLVAGIALTSFTYLVKGFKINSLSAKGVSGIAQANIDQPSLNYVMKLDREYKNATFVFISNDTGLEILHNRIITLQPIYDDLKINVDDYRYDGFAGPLFIVLPESYNGPKEKLIMKSFPGYTGFNESMLSNKYVLYTAKMKR